MAPHHHSDIIGRLTEKKRRQHEDTVRDFNWELTQISEVSNKHVAVTTELPLSSSVFALFWQTCATLVRSFSQEMLSSLQEVDVRLKSLRSRMDSVNGVSLQVMVTDTRELTRPR